MNMMISYQELVRTFPNVNTRNLNTAVFLKFNRYRFPGAGYYASGLLSNSEKTMACPFSEYI
ncbi:hypothetical protein C5Y84_12130 [Escherichia coli]|nr:hypothetical protein C5Y84_12130 [Escherichia coli]